MLDDIFRLAESHSAECRETRQALMNAGTGRDGKYGADELGAHEWAITSLCARIGARGSRARPDPRATPPQ